MSSSAERNALSTYRSELGAFRQLTQEQEISLVRQWRAGDDRAGAKLIGACLPFVMTIALEYRRWGIPTEDIVQEGNIGLLKAAARFDPERRCRLVTYAAYWIRAEIRDYVVRAYRVVRVGASKPERRALRHYRKTRERDPAALAAASGLTTARAEQLLPMLTAREVSLDDHEPGEPAAIDRVTDGLPTPEDEVSTRQSEARLRVALYAALDTLPARERTIVEQRCLTDKPPTLEEVGHRFGISKERVRQLEERAKHRIRAQVESLVSADDLESFAA